MSSIPVALQEATAEVRAMRDTFAKRANLIHGLVSQWPGVPCPKPTGAFYIFPDVSGCFGKTSGGGVRIEAAMEFASSLLDEARVAVVPGEGFLGCGANHVRLSFACSEDDIQTGCQRVREWLDTLS